MKTIVKILFMVYMILGSSSVFSQIFEGVITFERKINMIKKSDGKTSGRLKFTENNKYVLTYFNLYFKDSTSLFIPIATEEVNSFGGQRGVSQAMSLVTTNTVYQDQRINYRYAEIPVLNESFYLEDGLKNIQWKITEDKRLISGFECRKAVVYVTPTTRIYAWYSDEIVPTVGPESYWGLPGAILGLATEDGGVTYFATKVDERSVLNELIQPKINKNKTTTNVLSEKFTLLKAQNVMIAIQLNDLFIF